MNTLTLQYCLGCLLIATAVSASDPTTGRYAAAAAVAAPTAVSSASTSIPLAKDPRQLVAPRAPSRMLPGSKTSAPAARKNCQGAWGSWGACSSTSGGACPASTGKQSRTYRISSYQSGGGSACAASDGARGSQSCTPRRNCAGAWTAWTACSAAGKSTSTYKVSCAALGGGTACEKGDGLIKEMACVPTSDCVGSWGAWGACAAATSTQTSTYAVTSYQSGGGAPCAAAEGDTKDQACTPPPATTKDDTAKDDTNTSGTTTTPTKAPTSGASGAPTARTVTGSFRVSGAGKASSVTAAMRAALRTQIAGYVTGASAEDVTITVSDSLQFRRRAQEQPGRHMRHLDETAGAAAGRILVKYDVRTADETAARSAAAALDAATKSDSSNPGKLVEELRTKVGGTFAALKTSDVAVFAPALSKVIAVAWAAGGAPVGKHEYPLVACPLGSTVVLTWAKGQDDVVLVGTEEAYLDCATSATSAARVAVASAGAFSFPCTSFGTHFLASSVGGRCGGATRQRVRIHVSDPSRTEGLRATFNAKTGANHYSLAKVMEEDIIPMTSHANGGNPKTDAEADRILKHLWCVEPHSPAACADWIPPTLNTNATCLAWLNTDIGYVLRKKFTHTSSSGKTSSGPDLARAEEYYKRALSFVPGFCSAESYYSELLVQRGDKAAAALQFAAACKACGRLSLDIVDAQAVFKAKGWGDVAACTTDKGEGGVIYDSTMVVKPPAGNGGEFDKMNGAVRSGKARGAGAGAVVAAMAVALAVAGVWGTEQL